VFQLQSNLLCLEGDIIIPGAEGNLQNVFSNSGMLEPNSLPGCAVEITTSIPAVRIQRGEYGLEFRAFETKLVVGKVERYVHLTVSV
jgi:hypothetical protein